MEDLNGKVNLFMKPWKLMEKNIFLKSYEYFLPTNKDWV